MVVIINRLTSALRFHRWHFILHIIITIIIIVIVIAIIITPLPPVSILYCRQSPQLWALKAEKAVVITSCRRLRNCCYCCCVIRDFDTLIIYSRLLSRAHNPEPATPTSPRFYGPIYIQTHFRALFPRKIESPPCLWAHWKHKISKRKTELN